MSLAHSPSVVTNSMVLYYDMTNTKKSWTGQPTVNQFGIPTPDGSGNVTFAVQGTGTFQRIYSGTYGGYEIQSTDVVYKYVLGAAGCHYHGNTISVTTGQTPTWSFDYYIDPSTTGYPSTNYLANMESSIGVGAGITDPTPSIIGVWKRATQTSAAASSNGTFNAYLYPGACSSSKLADSGFILYKNPQVEFNSFATPFVAGTRASTGAIVDLTNNVTITANSLTYAADNTFSFNGSSDYITIPSNQLALTLWTQPWTLGVWMYVPASATWSDGVNRSHFVSKGSTAGIWGIIRGTTDNTIYAAIRTDAGLYQASGGSITRDAWCNVVGTWDGISAVRTYINGVLVGSSTAATLSGVPDTSNLFVGRSVNTVAGSPGLFYNGKVSNVVGYTSALSAAEVSQNFNALRSRYGL